MAEVPPGFQGEDEEVDTMAVAVNEVAAATAAAAATAVPSETENAESTTMINDRVVML